MFLKFPIRLNGDGLYEQKAQMLLAGSGEAHIINDLQYSCMLICPSYACSSRNYLIRSDRFRAGRGCMHQTS